MKKSHIPIIIRGVVTETLCLTNQIGVTVHLLCIGCLMCVTIGQQNKNSM